MGNHPPHIFHDHAAPITNSGTSYENLARHSFEEDPYYVTSITAMADHKEVVASEDIYAATGHKLVTKSTVINSGLREDLLRHKLLKPIDQSLIVKCGVTAESLAQEAARITEEDPRMRQLADGSGDADAAELFQQLARLPLSPQMAFKLTVAKEQQPRLFHHSLLVTLIAQYLAVSLELPERELTGLLCAALFHDLGELFTDPAVINSKGHLSETEWHHIYAHPIVGYLIVLEAADLEQAVSVAILQHQERLDGSGYPSGLRGAKIGLIARIISVADVCASILVRADNSNERLSTLLRLNRQKYDPKLLDLLYKRFGRLSAESSVGEMATLPQLKAVAQLLDKWGEFCAAMSTDGRINPPRGLEFLFERMVNLRSMLLQFGFDPDSLLQLVEIEAGDPQFARELSEALGELNWQFKELERETIRRGEANRAALRTNENFLLNCWIKELHAYLSGV